jgi:flagellar M-ring protein FliF
VPNAIQSNSAAAVSASDRSQSQEEQTESEQESVASHTRTLAEKASFVPTRVSASIGVPESYYMAVWRRKNPPVEGQPPATPQDTDLQTIREETKRTIEEAVVALFPKIPPGEDIYPHVRVNSFPDLPAPSAPPPSAAETATGWLAANWEMLAMVALACAGLLFVRSMVRQAPPPTSPAAANPLSPPGGAAGADEEDDEDLPPIRRFQDGPNLREELAELVQEDPDAAATVLRNWIGEVG